MNFSGNFSEAVSENGDVTFQRSQNSQLDASQSISSSQVTVVDPSLTIYGTDVNVEECQQKFRDFLFYDNFKMDALDPDERAGVSLNSGV